MNRLRDTFVKLQADGRKALLPYVTGGYPDAATTVEILKRVDASKCACVEVGIPFSDPIADGPVIQASFSRALESGFKLDALLGALRQNRGAIAVPLIAMVSYSIVYRRSPESFVQAAKDSGFDGLIVPDLALEEADELAVIGRAHECPLVLMVAPTSDEARRRRIAALSEPFIYYQSLAGVTGERRQLAAGLAEHVRELRADTAKPVCVGFGISTPQHVADVCRIADGAIVGSAIVRRISAAVEQDACAADVVRAVAEFIAELADAVPG